MRRWLAIPGMHGHCLIRGWTTSTVRLRRLGCGACSGRDSRRPAVGSDAQEARTHVPATGWTSWPSFYFDNFYSAFSAAEQNELLTPQAKQDAGDAYAGSMDYWNDQR